MKRKQMRPPRPSILPRIVSPQMSAVLIVAIFSVLLSNPAGDHRDIPTRTSRIPVPRIPSISLDVSANRIVELVEEAELLRQVIRTGEEVLR